ncbi:hypothetical protein [Marinitoga lauensis]|uniref:hypothetical protein n=1 Tax=Marinitoga lauensis TaxID=2201189 RepID=UPI0010102EBF|nr:hypothetical protein [Marinitoga lauensis]
MNEEIIKVIFYSPLSGVILGALISTFTSFIFVILNRYLSKKALKRNSLRNKNIKSIIFSCFL